jgi:hypothetical protein
VPRWLIVHQEDSRGSIIMCCCSIRPARVAGGLRSPYRSGVVARPAYERTDPSGIRFGPGDDSDARGEPDADGALERIARLVLEGAQDVDPMKGSLAPFFKRSQELVSFLQCGAGQGTAQAMYFARIVCNDLRSQ